LVRFTGGDVSIRPVGHRAGSLHGNLNFLRRASFAQEFHLLRLLERDPARYKNRPPPCATQTSMSVAEFLEGRPHAVVGASRDPSKFGNKVLRTYFRHGMPVFAVNPRESGEIEGVAVCTTKPRRR
jgi:hypothetical protein